MKKITVIGNFGDNSNVFDGQRVKTKIFTDELIFKYGKNNVEIVNTHKLKRNIFLLFFKLINSFKKSNNIIFISDFNGVRFLTFPIYVLNKIYKKNILLFVVGGWLVPFLIKTKSIRKILFKWNKIIVEIPKMALELNSIGFDNIVLINKFRNTQWIKLDEILFFDELPLRTVFFSRIFKEKGVEIAFNTLKKINDHFGKTVITITFIGPVEMKYRKTFENFLESNKSFSEYIGKIDFQKSFDILKNYHLMVFPSMYRSEGFPNAFIDAFSSGLPIVASDFNYLSDIIKNDFNGLLFNINLPESFFDVLKRCLQNKDIVNNMKKNMPLLQFEYLASNAIEIIDRNLI
jgi:glycosyltransferase involved in cell wall biosynthesis